MKINIKDNVKIIAVAALLALVMLAALLAVERYMAGNYEKKTVYTAASDIKAGTVITKKNAGNYFKETQVMKSLAAGSVIEKQEELYNTYITCDVKTGEILYKHNFRNDEEECGNIENPVEVSVSLSSFADGVSGTIRKGDYVFLYFSDKQTGATKSFTETPVYVKDAFTSAGVNVPISDRENAASVFTVVIDSSKNSELCSNLKTMNLTLVKTDNPDLRVKTEETDYETFFPGAGADGRDSSNAKNEK